MAYYQPAVRLPLLLKRRFRWHLATVRPNAPLFCAALPFISACPISSLRTNDVCADAGFDSLLVEAAVVHVQRTLEAEIAEAVDQMPPWTPDVMSGAQPSAAGYYNATWAATRYIR